MSVIEHHRPQRAERRVRARAALVGDGAENLQISRVIGHVRVAVRALWRRRIRFRRATSVRVLGGYVAFGVGDEVGSRGDLSSPDDDAGAKKESSVGERRERRSIRRLESRRTVTVDASGRCVPHRRRHARARGTGETVAEHRLVSRGKRARRRDDDGRSVELLFRVHVQHLLAHHHAGASRQSSLRIRRSLAPLGDTVRALRGPQSRPLTRLFARLKA